MSEVKQTKGSEAKDKGLKYSVLSGVAPFRHPIVEVNPATGKRVVKKIIGVGGSIEIPAKPPKRGKRVIQEATQAEYKMLFEKGGYFTQIIQVAE